MVYKGDREREKKNGKEIDGWSEFGVRGEKE